jgi:hypothetical protein
MLRYGQKFLPQAYVEILFVAIFCSTTFSSISPKTLQGKTPYEILNEFNANSVNAASNRPSTSSSEEQQNLVK